MSFTGLPSLERFPRIPLLDGPTPIQRLHRLEASLGDALGGVQIFVKRDDHMSLGGGGNKLRKLEYLIGAAQDEGVDTIVTVGGLQSNHARLTAAAAARVGIACELVLGRPVPRNDVDYEHNGNMLLNGIFGATLHTLPPGENSLVVAQQRADELRSQGRRVFVAPIGGSTPVGALGYMRCAQEIEMQAKDMGAEFTEIVVANGSAGTHAGLAAGMHAMGKHTSMVRSFAALAEGEQAKRTTLELTEATLRLFGIETSLTDTDIQVDGGQRGVGYGIPTEGMLDALRTMARTEGLLLDPVYSGKAFAGLLADLRARRYVSGQQVLFVMTGGTPGLYAYRSIF
jgi:L-cysteate sulfo-lyase